MPPAFRAEPGAGSRGGVRVRAVVGDLMESLLHEPADQASLAPFNFTGSITDRNRLRWVLAACHVLWHPALRGRALPADGVRRLLVQEMAALAAVAPFDGLAAEEERREELARRTIDAAGLRLPGESETDAADRLTQVDSIERRRLLAAAAEKQQRAREIQKELRRRAEAEAASKPSSE
ncbi:MAG: hypothetical protein FD180_2924 [Planctomycetota bacterium]|nr:MAG: hypothetical protein FD180_2924 [Planctomycetota bacterium]